MSSKAEHQTVPLSVLLKREVAQEKIERPEIFHGQAGQSKKGEDLTLVKTECQRVAGDGVSTYSVFAVRFVVKVFVSKPKLLCFILVIVCMCFSYKFW